MTLLRRYDLLLIEGEVPIWIKFIWISITFYLVRLGLTSLQIKYKIRY
jgi:hypothetical protein